MLTEQNGARIAVIGMGPRGLGALEALATRLSETGLVADIDIFDPVSHLGAGPNFSPDESELCLLNIPVREISVAPPRFPGAGIGTFANWSGLTDDAESFPPRATLGAYFNARFCDLKDNAKSLRLSHKPVTVLDIVKKGDEWWVVDATGHQSGPYSEVLLTQGQPETKADDQLLRWQEHARNCEAELMPAYPGIDLSKAAEGWAGQTVAIRGLGLSTLDVLRLLSTGVGGRFESGRYHPSGREPAVILPFSLDGHAPVPKPANAELDERFDPTQGEIAEFGAALGKAKAEAPEAALATVSQALVAPVMRILSRMGKATQTGKVQSWLEMERDVPGSQETQSPTDALRMGIAMADGQVLPSVGFVVGQVWRKWQNTLRAGFNAAEISVDTRKALIGFDEGLKRYSYGPPVRSAKELLMLIEAQLVDLRAADDPDILLVEDGWEIVEKDRAITASVMIDAVMPSPALDGTADRLIRELLSKGHIGAVADGLGAGTKDDGQLIRPDGSVQRGLSLLGRLALGSVIAVDSVHDCFGAASQRWADGVVARLN